VIVVHASIVADSADCCKTYGDLLSTTRLSY
jgi:hypothetical protein